MGVACGWLANGLQLAWGWLGVALCAAAFSGLRIQTRIRDAGGGACGGKVTRLLGRARDNHPSAPSSLPRGDPSDLFNPRIWKERSRRAGKRLTDSRWPATGDDGLGTAVWRQLAAAWLSQMFTPARLNETRAGRRPSVFGCATARAGNSRTGCLLPGQGRRMTTQVPVRECAVYAPFSWPWKPIQSRRPRRGRLSTSPVTGSNGRSPYVARMFS